MNKKFRDPKVRLVIPMILFGTLGMFVRKIDVTSGELALYRALLASLVILVFFILKRQKLSFQKIKTDLPLLLLSGAAMGFNWILLFEAYKYTTVSVATLSYYFAPVIVTVTCPVLFKERMTRKQWVCFFMSTLGIVLITGVGDLSEGKQHVIGILFGLGAACLYAAVVLLNKYMKNVEGLHRTFLQFVAAIVVLFPYVGASGQLTLSRLDMSGWICLLIVGILHTGIAYCLYFPALKELPGQKAAILSYIDPLVAVLLSVTVLGEAMTGMQMAGGALILGFALWNEME